MKYAALILFAAALFVYKPFEEPAFIQVGTIYDHVDIALYRHGFRAQYQGRPLAKEPNVWWADLDTYSYEDDDVRVSLDARFDKIEGLLIDKNAVIISHKTREGS